MFIYVYEIKIMIRKVVANNRSKFYVQVDHICIIILLHVLCLKFWKALRSCNQAERKLIFIQTQCIRSLNLDHR